MTRILVKSWRSNWFIFRFKILSCDKGNKACCMDLNKPFLKVLKNSSSLEIIITKLVSHNKSSTEVWTAVNARFKADNKLNYISIYHRQVFQMEPLLCLPHTFLAVSQLDCVKYVDAEKFSFSQRRDFATKKLLWKKIFLVNLTNFTINFSVMSVFPTVISLISTQHISHMKFRVAIPSQALFTVLFLTHAASKDMLWSLLNLYRCVTIAGTSLSTFLINNFPFKFKQKQSSFNICIILNTHC